MLNPLSPRLYEVGISRAISVGLAEKNNSRFDSRDLTRDEHIDFSPRGDASNVSPRSQRVT